MPRYAHFDPAVPSPAPIKAWYDTDLIQYPSLPPRTELVRLSNSQWNERLSRDWGVEKGRLVPTEKPLPIRARLRYSVSIELGAKVRFGSAKAEEIVFPLTESFVAQIQQLARDFVGGLGLPHDAPTVTVLDLAEQEQKLTGQQVAALYRRIRDLRLELHLATRRMEAGEEEVEWPAQELVLP